MNEASICLHVEALEEDGFVATSPDVPGLVAEGRSITETVEIAQGLVRKIAEVLHRTRRPASSCADITGLNLDNVVTEGDSE